MQMFSDWASCTMHAFTKKAQRDCKAIHSSSVSASLDPTSHHRSLNTAAVNYNGGFLFIQDSKFIYLVISFLDVKILFKTIECKEDNNVAATTKQRHAIISVYETVGFSTTRIGRLEFS